VALHNDPRYSREGAAPCYVVLARGVSERRAFVGNRHGFNS
jgi:hypothetical protein